MASPQDRPHVGARPKPQRRAVSSAGIGLGRIFGIGVRIDWSLLIIFALVLFELGARVFPSWHPEWSTALVWGMAVATAVLFFASVLVHELAHAIVARAQDIPVHGITLFLFGGYTQLEAEPASPKAEFWMAIVGPIASVLIGVVATIGGVALIGESLQSAAQAGDPQALQAAFAAAGPGATLLLWLGPINLILGTVSVNDVRGVPRERWPVTTVDQIMTPVAAPPALPPDAGAERALQELANRDVDQLVILEGRKLLGFVRRGDLVRWIDFHGLIATHDH